MTDWKRNGLPLESITPLPDYNGPLISPKELLETITEAEKNNCRNAQGELLLTLIDFRSSISQKNRIGGDRFRIKTTCPEITAQLDDFVDNEELFSRIPKQGTVVCVSETGKRDSYLQRYLYPFGFSNIISLENGMRGWLKADYPKERLQQPGK